MQHSRSASANMMAMLAFPPLVPASQAPALAQPRRGDLPVRRLFDAPAETKTGQVRASVLSFQNMHLYGDLLVNFLRARKKVFIDRLHWHLPEAEGMEFDQYDTPLCRWIVIHEFGEVLGGIRLTPTTARCGMYSYMLRDAQRGLLQEIPTDVLFFDAPVSRAIWEASRLFIAEDVPSQRRFQIQAAIMDALSRTACDLGASQVIGIVPAVWSRWLRRIELDAVPVGPKFAIDGTVSQAALFNTLRRRN